MIQKRISNYTTIDINQSVEGETIEDKVRRITKNKEPITDGAPLIYTERKDGVLPEHDIRADRWDIAIDAKSVEQKTYLAKREEIHKPKEEPKKVGETQPLQGTESSKTDVK